jgi:outer membrane receptor protein involved in Fe transport
MIRNVQKTLGSFRAALAVGVTVPILVAASAFAQAVSPTPAGQSPATPMTGSQPGAAGNASPAPQPANQAGGTAETERVIVTGSNIPTAEEVGPNPVLSLNRDLINKSGESSIERFLIDQPVANAQNVAPQNNATGFTPGASTIALRGFDPRATLILVDGRRVAPYPIGIVGIVFVDLNSIPQAAIQSIEILKDGASTTYGADAIAGVVNLKFRHDYRGAEATVYYGNTLDKDAGRFTSSLIFGIGDGTTEVTGVMNYYHENSIFNKDRGFSQVPPFLSSNASPGNFQLSAAAVAAAGGTVPINPGTGLPRTTFFGSPGIGTTGNTPASNYIYSGGRSQVFNFNLFSQSTPESERYGGYVNFTHKVFGDSFVIYGDMAYQNVKTHNELAAAATGSFQTAGQVTLAIPPHAPGPTLGGPTYEETGVQVGAFNPFNPFQQIISGGSRYRLAEFGNRLFDSETDAFFTTLGVKGDKLFDGTWGYDGAFRYSQLKDIERAQVVSTSRFDRILNAADPIFNPASPQYIGTTIPYNPFGDFRNPPPTNAATVAYATVHPKDYNLSKLATLDFTMYTTALFNLPAGGVGFAFGGQFRRENIDQVPDEINLQGDTIGSSPAAITHGGRKSYGLYTEAIIPIFSAANAIPGFHALEFTAAGRYEAFMNNDTNVMVPKFGMRWQPLDDSLTFRSTWGKGFREPSLYELYASPTASLQTSHDPLNGTLANGAPCDPRTTPGCQPLLESETATLTQSNPNLQPEDSNAFTAGIVYTPKYVPGLTLSVDLYDIERTGVVNAPTPDQVLQREAAGALLAGERVERDAGGFISRVVLSNQNSGAEISRGVDLGFQYQMQTAFGTFTSYTNATYLDAFLFQSVTTLPVTNFRGRTVDEGSSNDGFLKWRGNSRLNWNWNGLDITTSVRYFDGFHEHKPDLLVHWVKQEWLFDVQGSYDFTFVAPVEQAAVAGYSKDAKNVVKGKDGKEVQTSQTANYGLPIWKRALNGTTITVGCQNVFGQDPPQAYGEGGNSVNYPGFLYTPTGRFVYMQLTKKF